MLIVLAVVAIALFIAGAVMSEKSWDGSGTGLSIFACFMFIGVLIFSCYDASKLINLRVIDDKIAMYEEENAKIETQIANVVEQYQKYETEIFTEVAPESSVTLVSLYPELKSDTLVQSQIDIYVQNNEKIKELREKKINEKIYRWWLYFGGK